MAKQISCLWILGCLLLMACHQEQIYDNAVDIPNEQWIQDMPACFNVPIVDTTCFCSMSLNIRNSVDYGFSNLYLFITMVLPDGRMARDTVNCLLASKDGRWLGKGMGSIKTLNIPFRTDMVFPMSGMYQFYVEQAMRTDTLIGIKNIGIRIDKEIVEK